MDLEEEMNMNYCRQSHAILIMKMVVTLMVISASLCAQSGPPIVLSPAIGDTLDPFERYQLDLFPDVDGFQWAVFFIKEKAGNLSAKISSIHEGRSRLQIVNMGITPGFLQRKIELTFGVTAKSIVSELPTAERIPQSHPIRNPATDKVVILSPRVGNEIDLGERDRFGLFSHLKGFVSAVFFQTPDTVYYVRISISGKQGTTEDTCIEFTERAMLMMAERIEHYEGLVDGSYMMNQSPVAVHVEGGTEITRRAAASDSGKSIGRLSDILPFATAPSDFSMDSDWGFAVSLSTYSPDFGSVESALRAIEDAFRAQGFLITRRSPDFTLSPLLWYSMRFRLKNDMTLFLETGRSTSTVVFKAVSIFLLYYIDHERDRQFKPFVGAGVGRYYVRAGAIYGNHLVGYNYLDEIVIEGASYGVKFLGGYELNIAPQASLSAHAEYLYVPTIRTTLATGTKAELHLSSLMLVARLTLFF